MVIDAPPGGYADVMPLVKEKGLTVKALLLTHGHFDHVLDTALYQKDGVPVYVHRDSEQMVRDPAAWMPFPFPGMELQTLEWGNGDHILEGDGEWSLAGIKVRVLAAPGHCPGSLVFHMPEASAAFVGDVIFYRSVGRTDLPGGDTATLIGSISSKIMTLPEGTLLHPGHGPLTLVEEEREYNPYING